MIGHTPITLVAFALPVAACSAEAPQVAADPCAAVKQRYAAHRELIEPKMREIEARDKAELAAGKSSLERTAKYSRLMVELEGEEMRYRVGMRDCAGTQPQQKTGA